MTLEEAIKHYGEMPNGNSIKLVGWLTELKQRREKDNDTMAFWMPKKVDASHYHYYCSNCNFRSKYFKSKYCPECGKEMDI